MILTILVMLISFALLAGVITVQISEFGTAGAGMVLLITWTIFLAIFIGAILEILKAGG